MLVGSLSCQPSLSQLIVCGLTLGYDDPGHCPSHFRTPREPVEAIATFYGD
jgi:hypothetical protein